MTNKHRGGGNASSEERHLAAIGVDRHTRPVEDIMQGGAVVQDIAHLGDQPVLGEHRFDACAGLSMEDHIAE